MGGALEPAGRERRLVEEMAGTRYTLRRLYKLAAAGQDHREYVRLVEM